MTTSYLNTISNFALDISYMAKELKKLEKVNEETIYYLERANTALWAAIGCDEENILKNPLQTDELFSIM